MQKVTIVTNRVVRELQKTARDLMEAGAVHGVRDERAVARPDVRVVVVVAPLDVGVRSGDDAALMIAMRLHDQQRAPVEIEDLLR